MDESRFRELFDRTYPALIRFAHHRGLNTEDAADLVASTFEVAWRRIGEVPPGEEAVPWLFAVAFNQIRNHRRRSSRARDLNRKLITRSTSWSEPDSGDLLVGDLRLALSHLRPTDRELIMLIAWDGLTPAEAAKVLGCSPIAVRSRLHRARKRIGGYLERSDGLEQRRSGDHPLHVAEVESVKEFGYE